MSRSWRRAYQLAFLSAVKTGLRFEVVKTGSGWGFAPKQAKGGELQSWLWH